jgi:hypothetical protein
MYKRPIPRRVFDVDKSTLKLARSEDGIVHRLIRVQSFPPYKPPVYAPILQVENLIFGLRRHGEITTDEEAEALRRKNYVAPQPVKVKRIKKRIVRETDLDKVFSEYTKPVEKKKILKAVVKKM